MWLRASGFTSGVLLAVCLASACLIGCSGRNSESTQTPAAKINLPLRPSELAEIARADVTKPGSLAVFMLRKLEADIPELSKFERDAVRIEQAVMAQIRVKAKVPSAPRTKSGDDSTPPDDARSTILASRLSRKPLSLAIAGFVATAAAAEQEASSGPDLGLYLGFLGTDMADSIPGGSTPGPISSQASEGGTQVGITFDFGKAADGTRTSAMSFDFKISKEGASLSCKTAPKVEGDPCPDADGKVSMKYSITLRCDGAAGAKRGGMQLEFTGTATAHVNDSAYITSIDFDSRSQNSTQRPTHNAYIDFTYRGSLSGTPGIGNDWKVTSSDVSGLRAGSETTRNDVEELAQEGGEDTRQIVIGYMYWLQDKWRNGYCVAVHAPVPDSVSPGSSTAIEVTVETKRDGAIIHAPVNNTLKGQTSLTPSRIAPSPGTATYVAPSEHTSATLTFKSTSRRGIGTLEATVNAGHAYTASGGEKITMSGTVCDLEKSFHLAGAGNNGVNYDFTFSPNSPRSGSVNYSGSAGGCTEAASGTYTIQMHDYGKTGTVECKVTGKVSCMGVGGAFSGGGSFTLTEAPSGTCR